MANDYLGLAEIAQLNDTRLSDIDVDDLLIDAPFLAQMAAVPSSNGEYHRYLKTTVAPSVGFRDVNDGREHDHSERTQVDVQCKLLDASFTVDLALVQNLASRERVMGMELTMHLRSAFSQLETQVIYGDQAPGATAGFTGINDTLDSLSDAMVLGQGGTTNLTSVYLVRSTPEDVALVAGHDGRIAVNDPVEQRVDGATGFYPALFQSVQGWYAVQMGSIHTAARLANFDAGSNTVDDDAIFAGLELFPSTRWPNYIVMNRRSLHQLRASRTATNATGAPAPLPQDVAGIPIVTTDHVLNTETAVA